MNSRFFLSPVFLLVLAGSLSAAGDPVSEKIDALVEESCKQRGILPNPPASESTLVRRLYLDIAGRIPGADELRTFTESADPAKRSKLIDQLLASEGYVSNMYNWWSDILRVQTGQREETGTAYAEWIKDSLRANETYDHFVNDMITAKGFVWDNGAVGYYVRDAGMPLDNMSNTAQIFLGTRLVCAQCHNHPFDKWTQKDYYQMAAYTYGVDTEINPRSIYRRLAEQETKAGKRLTDSEQRSMRTLIEDILEPLKYGVQEGDRQLKLPTDYKYDDAKPGDPVKAKTIFGDRATATRDAREHYAEWLTSAQNPRFTTVIANRLWKRAMGMGLIEPVDDYKDDTSSSNPALIRYLADQMVRMRFDVRKFQRVIYNSRTYQREATRMEVAPDAPYYFPGPLLRRMTAEQIWDSICTLVIPDPDQRKRSGVYKEKLAGMKMEAEGLKACEPKAIVAVARKYAELDADLDIRIKAMRLKLNRVRDEGQTEDANAVQKELNGMNKQRDDLALKARAELLAEQAGKTKSSFVGNQAAAPGMAPKPALLDNKSKETMMPLAQEGTWKGYGEEFLRASELPSPAPMGHFLREFGQGNREVIENSSSEASVSQALNLMNGPLFAKLTMDNTMLMRRFNDCKDDETRTSALFLSIYGRPPGESEAALVREAVAAKTRDGWKDIIWALLNSREFVFVQ